MARTEIGTRQILDGSVNRDDIDTTTTGKALVTKIIAGDGIDISSTGVDAGTGDVTVDIEIPVTIANGGTNAITRQAAIDNLTDSASATTGHVLTKNGSGNAVWAASGSSLGVQANNSYIQWRNAANDADIDVLRVNSSDNTQLNAASTKKVFFSIAGTESWAVEASGTLRSNGNGTILPNTSDASDSAYLNLCGGGAFSSTRGAYIQLAGNESTDTGHVQISAGNVSGGQIKLNTSGILQWAIDESGILRSSSSGTILASTADAADNQYTAIGGGGALSTTRGAGIYAYGNENANTGKIQLVTGNVTGQAIEFFTGGLHRWNFNADGHLLPNGTLTFDIGNSTNQVNKVFSRYFTSQSGFSARFGTDDAATDMILMTGATDRWRVRNTGHFEPDVDNTYNIGSSSKHVSVVYSVGMLSASNSSMFVGTTGASTLFLQTNNTNRWFVHSTDGSFVPNVDNTYQIGTSSTRPSAVYGRLLNASRPDSNGTALSATGTHASYTGAVVSLDATRGANSGYNLLLAYSGAGSDLEFRLRGDGNGTCDGTWTGGGADYAEYFESVTGTSLTIGQTVVLDNEKVRLYDDQIDSLEDIVGVVRPKSGGTAMAGNHPLNWHNKYLRDDFGAYILDGNGERQLNPSYDPESEYVERSERSEWNLIGLLGQIPVLNTATKNPAWKLMKVISDDVKLYFVR